MVSTAVHSKAVVMLLLFFAPIFVGILFGP